MNEKAIQSVESYNSNADSLSALYNGLVTEDVLPGIESILPVRDRKRIYRALDLGCGSGRDAFWLAAKGFHVVGADASVGMIRNARKDKMHGAKTVFIEDEMPDIKRVRGLNQKYDFYLMSASWMHLDKAERRTMIDCMYRLARANATAYVSLRHGPSPDGRPMAETSIEELRDLAAEIALASSVVLPAKRDKQGRPDVTWDYVGLQFLADRAHPAFA